MSASPTPLSGPRRGKALRVALVLSLALNLFFLGGAAWIRMHPLARHHGFAARLRAVGAGLDLDPQQHAAFIRYVADVRGGFRQRHQAIEPLIDQGWSELAKPEINKAALMRVVDQVADTRRTFEHKLAADTLSFLATLSPKQRARFVELARRHRHREGPGR